MTQNNALSDQFLAAYQATMKALSQRYKPGLLDYAELHLTSTYKEMIETQTMVMAVLDNPDKYPEIGIKEYQELLKKWYSQMVQLAAMYAKCNPQDRCEAQQIEIERLSLSS